MKLEFGKVYSGFLIALVVLLLWVVWVGAQTNSATNAAPQTTTVSNANAAATLNTGTNGVESAARHQMTFGLDRIEWLQHDLFGNPLWKYVASILYILLALYASKLIDLFFHAWLRRWTAKTETQFDDLMVDLIHGPVKVVCFVVLLHIGLNLFTWPEWVSHYLSIGLQLLVAGSLTYLALKFIDLLMNYWKSHAAVATDKSFNEQLYPVIRKTARAFIIVVAVLLTTQNLGLNITSVLASLSIGGLAVGLAAQDTLANLFGAVSVFLDKPFHVGDRIRMEGGIDGVVESIGMRSTRIRSLDGFHIIVPNKTMGNSTIINVTRRPTIRTDITLGLTYDTPVEQLQRALGILDEIFGKHPMTQEVTITFSKFGDSSLNIQIIHMWKSTDYKAYLKGMQEINLAIKQRFDKAGLNMAFPTQTLYVKQDSDWRFASASPGRAAS